MKKLASYDIKQFREQYNDLKYLKTKTGGHGFRGRVSRKSEELCCSSVRIDLFLTTVNTNISLAKKKILASVTRCSLIFQMMKKSWR